MKLFESCTSDERESLWASGDPLSVWGLQWIDCLQAAEHNDSLERDMECSQRLGSEQRGRIRLESTNCIQSIEAI